MRGWGGCPSGPNRLLSVRGWEGCWPPGLARRLFTELGDVSIGPIDFDLGGDAGEGVVGSNPEELGVDVDGDGFKV